MPEPLPLLSSPPVERRDAARNREVLLTAAAEMISSDGMDELTMGGLAAKAGVGKGTVFRRFGSREGLMAALLDHSAKRWQAAVISGPPPLGPGAPPLARLLAFGEARLHTHLEQTALIEEAGSVWRTNYAVAAFVSLHVRHLLTALGVDGDLGYLATALMAPLDVPVLRQQIDHEGRSPEQILAGWSDLVHRVIGSSVTQQPEVEPVDQRLP